GRRVEARTAFRETIERVLARDDVLAKVVVVLLVIAVAAREQHGDDEREGDASARGRRGRHAGLDSTRRAARAEDAIVASAPRKACAGSGSDVARVVHFAHPVWVDAGV